MGASGAERQRRYRRHRAGDHSLCLPERCPETAPAAPPTTPGDGDRPSQPADVVGYAAPPWGERGRRLWEAMADARLGPAHRVLLEEACRLADRLDRLDQMIESRSPWVQLAGLDDESDDRVVVVVDALLSETRQHATALRGLVAELRQALAAGRKAPVPDGATSRKGGGGIADLAAAAARRRAAAR